MIAIGLIGSGFVARLRAEAIAADVRSQLVATASRSLEAAKEFTAEFGGDAVADWQELVHRADIDLVIVTHINRDHGTAAEAALAAGKHVVVEYPLSLDVSQAQRLAAIAQQQQRLLHVEHIELLGGLHQAACAHLSQVGTPQYVRYSTIAPRRPAPDKWTYQPALFGFPLVGALSRVHRLTSLLGAVESIACQARYDGQTLRAFNQQRYRTGLCLARLDFSSGAVAEIAYGKGEALWQPSRRLEIHGSEGALIFEGSQGTLVTPAGESPLEVAGRRGLFAKDTHRVLDYLCDGRPLYVDLADSLYALEVADRARQAAESEQQF